MTDKYAIFIAIEHEDGSATSRVWTPVSADAQEAVAALLGPTTYTSHVPAEAIARLAPDAGGDAITVWNDEHA